MLKERALKFILCKVSSDFIDNKPINYKKKDEVKKPSKNETDLNKAILLLVIVYIATNVPKHQTIKNIDIW